MSHSSQQNRPSLGRSKAEKGLEQHDSPPVILDPLFAHEPLLVGVKVIGEFCCGKGNLVVAMRARGLKVYASDIQYRGRPDSTVLNFFEMTERPADCEVLLTNPPFSLALKIIEHAFQLGVRLVILLLKTNFLNTEKRFDRLFSRGHLRRVYPFRERIQDMHDAAFIEAGGEPSSQTQDHSWFVFDRNYCGPWQGYPNSLENPTATLPWQNAPRCESCNNIIHPQRSTARFCSGKCRQSAYRKRNVSVTREAAE